MNGLDFERALSGAAAVRTGHSRLDKQSFMGKVAGTVAAAAYRAGVKTYCLAGDIAAEVTDDMLAENHIELAVKCASSDDWNRIKVSAHADLYKVACALKAYLTE